MPVDGYLELFTTLFGWEVYDIIWNVLRDSGILFLPFLGILIDNFVEPYRGGSYGTRVSLSLQRMEIDIFLAFLVLVLAGQPFNLTPFTGSMLVFQPPANVVEPAPDTATVHDSHSTYGVTGFTGTPDTVNVPLWWYGVISLSGAIDQAIVAGLPPTGDMRAYEQQARLATIADPELRSEVGRFYSECFVPARSKYLREQPKSSAIKSILDDKGDNDPEWMGSYVYRNTPGYYADMAALRQVPGWPYDPHRDIQYDPTKPPPKWGHPTCKQWWESGPFSTPGGTNKGLREKLVDSADKTSGGVKASLARLVHKGLGLVGLDGLTPEGQLDVLAKTVLNNSPPVWSNNDFSNNNNALPGVLGKAEGIVKGVIADGGLAVFAGLFSVTMSLVVKAMPIVQATVLFTIYALLPFFVVLSRYSIGMLFTGAMLIFTVKFWDVLWYLTLWLDQNLLKSMYPDGLSFLNGTHIEKRTILNLIITSLYLGLPIFWSGLMALAGVRIGVAINEFASGTHRPNQQAGEAGGNIARRIGTGGRL